LFVCVQLTFWLRVAMASRQLFRSVR